MLATTFPQVITHEKVLVDCEDDLNHFLKTMDALEDFLISILRIPASTLSSLDTTRSVLESPVLNCGFSGTTSSKYISG
jgi:hypothetical protein